jgi:hypothetical protein
MPLPSPTDFDTVIGIMRLARKYDAQYLFRRAISHLESMYPTDLPTFLASHHRLKAHHIDFVPGIGTDFSVLRAASEVRALRSTTAYAHTPPAIFLTPEKSGMTWVYTNGRHA